MVAKDKPKVNLAKVANNMDILEALLEILNEQLDKYVPKKEIEGKFKKKLDPRNKVDPTSLHNSLENILISAEGMPLLPPTNKQGLSDDYAPHTAEYLSDTAQILQTKLIQKTRLPIQEDNGNQTEQDCYKITVRGLEELDAIKLNKNIKQFKDSSESSNFIVAVLTFVLVAIGIIQILAIINPKGVATSDYTTITLFSILGIFVAIGIWIFVKYVVFGVFVRAFSKKK